MMSSKFLEMVAATVTGGVGWWLGDHVGTVTAFFLMLVGTAVGVVATKMLVRNLLG